ncbi:MAG: N-6 DNA methylase [Candidatus Goldbacteria bacterium]|nr:N-6 DNA methylase [Candidatus Goldiibacteriota bacterium]
MDKEKAKQNLERLVTKFKSEFEAGKTDNYTEEETKAAFITPLLCDVLGWDVTNRDEVTMEHKTSRGRVDYGIKLNNKIIFFVEAKPIRYELENAIPQAVKYCFNRKDVPFVLLTDFEGIMFFDVTVKPELRNIKKGIKINLKWNEYIDKFDELWQLSKPEVIAGSLEKLFTLKPKDRVSVDKTILSDLENWRESLAKNLYRNNKNLFYTNDREKDAQFLKEITQKILDRIIFIRFCEDRQLTQIRPIKQRFDERGENVGINTYIYILSGLFREYETVFNSDLFKSQDWERDLFLDFKVANKIIQETYDPYMFDVIPIEVLGNIYEQYLGYTIKFEGDSIKYEPKPEVRKAGGIYYTPAYIVDYIVKNTVGKLLEELPETKIKKLRILDPACGSGSFLIRAYEEMLKYYEKLKKNVKTKIIEGQTSIEIPEAETKLAIQEKAEILKNHIFGVDIDEQAVEVTKLSLMLKMLEGEWGFVKGTAVLPMLDKNIKCGNSLISGNVLELTRYFGNDYYKVKPFNWEEEFKEIMNDGGFDCVIGNPPYIKYENLSDELKRYAKENYKCATGFFDIFQLFLEKSFTLLKKQRKMGFIFPSLFLKGINYLQSRKYFYKNSNIEIIFDYGDGVFEKVQMPTCVMVLRKDINGENIVNFYSKKTIDDIIYYKVKQKAFNNEDFIYSKPNLCQKISKDKIQLKNLALITRGLEIGRKKIKNSKKGIKIIFGEDITRYQIKNISYIDKNTYEKNKKTIEIFKNPKIIIRETGSRITATYDESGIITNRSLYCIRSDKIDLKYLLAIINSRLIQYYYENKYKTDTDIFPKIRINQVKQIPIMPIDSKQDEKFKNLIGLVNVILELKTKIIFTSGQQKENLQIQIDKVDKEIDNLVYELYGITEDEKKIIEENL